MGNCTSGTQKKGKKDLSPHYGSSINKKEDVTYASIDHGGARGSRRTRAAVDDDCDYATVNIPAALQPEPEGAAKDECEDDYVLMS